MTSFSLYAQTDFAIESGNKLTTKLTSEYGQISNFLYQDDNEESTGYFKVEPSVFIQTQLSRHLFQLDANIRHYKFSNFENDDHSNLKLTPKYFLKLDHNKTFFAEAKLHEEYEYRGTGLSLGDAKSITTGDEKKTVSVKLGYLYGQDDSVAKLKFSIGQNDFRYKTRRSQSNSLDRVDTSMAVNFDYLLSGKTYFAADLTYTQSEFDHNERLNKDTYAGLVGVKWQSTAITQLQALIGYQELNFEDTELASDNAFKWRVDLNWRPTNFIQMNVNTQRNFEAANRLADSYRVVDSADIQIINKFTDYFQTLAVIGYRQEEIIYSNKSETENYFHSKIKLNYQRNEWLTIFVAFTFEDLDASEGSLNYRGDRLSLGFSGII